MTSVLVTHKSLNNPKPVSKPSTDCFNTSTTNHSVQIQRNDDPALKKIINKRKK